MHLFEKCVVTAIQKHTMLHPQDGVIVGFSGGADSVALLHVLFRLRALYDLRLTAVHVHHGLRGISADEDLAFCRAFCERLGIPLRAVFVQADEFAQAQHITVEEAGRVLRYQAFERIQREANAQKIAVAHHQNDQAETILMRIVRGTGAAGLRGIPFVRGGVIRPMLDLSRAEIEQYCADEGLRWRTDESNWDNRYTRNKIRNRILPMLEREMNPAAVTALAKMALLAEEDNALLDSLAEEAYADCRRDGGLDINGLLALPIAVKRRVVRLAAGDAGGLRDVHFRHIDDILALTTGQTGKSVCLPRGLCVCRTYDLLRFIQSEAEAEAFSYALSMGEAVYVPQLNQTVSLSEKETLRKNVRKLCTKRIDCDRIKQGLQIRTRLPGDVIALPGGTKKLKKYWIDAKVPRAAREGAVLLADGNEIVWIAGGALSAAYAAVAGTKRQAFIELWEGSL